jgi:hypothetical protein
VSGDESARRRTTGGRNENGAAGGLSPAIVPRPGDSSLRPASAYDGPTLEWLRAHPARWATWLAGYQRGYQDGDSEGYGRGCDEKNAEWTGTTVVACRTGLALGALAEAQRCCGRYASEPLTAAEIMRRAAASWEEL